MLNFAPSDYPEKCVVYAAMNLVNQKLYIGATEKGLYQRQQRHLWNARTGRKGKFYNAIRKYGENAFWFYILAPCDNFWEALEEEREFIRTLKPEYNLTDGGGGIKGYKFSDETKRKMSEAKIGKPGRITVAHPVRCITDNRNFISISDAAKFYGISRSVITDYCTKKSKSRKGLEFEYLKKEKTNV